jgi:hypothetical protein
MKPKKNSQSPADAEGKGREQARQIPREIFAASITPESVNAEKRSVDVIFYTGVKVARYNWELGDYWLTLDLKPGSVRLGRLNNGAPVLDSHSDWSLSDVIGVVEKGWIEDGKGKATFRFSDRAEVEPIWNDVKTGILRNISMGIVVHAKKDVTPNDEAVKQFLATDWEPMEISVVPIPADPGAGFLSFEDPDPDISRATAPKKESIMDEENNKPAVAGAGADGNQAREQEQLKEAKKLAAKQGAEEERQRAAGIRQAMKAAKLDETLADDMIAAGTSLADARTKILEKLAAQSQDNPIRSQVDIVRDADMARMTSVENMLLHRMDPTKFKLEAGREYNGQSMLDLCKIFLSAHGIRYQGQSKLEIARLALQTTSDFPLLLANAGTKRLRDAYQSAPTTYRIWARRAPNAPDFKQMLVVNLGGTPDLLQTNEHGEFKYGSMSEAGEVYAVLTYGRIVGFTRQAIINDDLRGFDRLLVGFGNSAARLENRTVYAQLTANANLADGIALFAASPQHGGNLAAAAAVISVASLTAGRAVMRRQLGLQGEELNLAPRFLLVPATIEQVAYQYTSAQFVPATPATINEFRTGGRTALEPVVDSVLDSNSPSHWYLAADPAQMDTVEYCYLDGNEGVYTEQRLGFEVDGMEIKARLDFAAKVIDYRGLYLNAI